jgi:hypothetical protein
MQPNQTPILCPPNKTCDCKERCNGYGTRVDCPPLIVIAALAMDHIHFPAQTESSLPQVQQVQQ